MSALNPNGHWAGCKLSTGIRLASFCLTLG